MSAAQASTLAHLFELRSAGDTCACCQHVQLASTLCASAENKRERFTCERHASEAKLAECVLLQARTERADKSVNGCRSLEVTTTMNVKAAQATKVPDVRSELNHIDLCENLRISV